MRDWIFCAAACLFAATPLPAIADDSGAQRGADIASLTHAKVVHWRKLYREQDVKGLQQFLNDDFVLLDASGEISTKSAEVAWLRDNPWSGADDFVYTIADIIFLNDDTAIVYGHGDSTRENAAGQPCAHRYWSSNTFKRVGGAWRPSFSHISGVTCTPMD